MWLDGLHVGGVYNVQWDGKLWALASANNVLRFNFDRSSGTQEGTVYLRKNDERTARFWIAGKRIVAVQPEDAHRENNRWSQYAVRRDGQSEITGRGPPIDSV